MRWSIAQLLPILIVSHVVVTLIFFTIFSPPDTVVQRVPSQPFVVAENFFAENTPISVDTPVPEAEDNGDKKIIYATVRAHRVAEQNEVVIHGGDDASPSLPGAGGEGKPALVPGTKEDSDRPLSWAYPNTGKPLQVKENRAMLESVHPTAEAPLFTIVMAAYKQAKFIEETFKSVVEQTYPHWELIIVDDGSPDDTWEKANALLETHPKSRVRIVRKNNGGLADARNVGLTYARGSWLCMLDSDDLLGKDYLQRAVEVLQEDPDVSIIPGCMKNFDAATSDWCFPEGYSTVGISHWNKFHASVLVAARLMRKVGGYDPGIPWGLEDWNFWLSASPHQPRVRFIPEPTFWYRQHAGTSMRKAMFASHLEETKVRTNHGLLYEPLQLLRDHETISAMARNSQETVQKLNDKILAYPTAGMPYFWRALHRVRHLRVELALTDLRAAAGFVKGANAWQVHYHTALLLEANDDLPGALVAINLAFRWVYVDDVLAAKFRIERALGGQAAGLQKHKVLLQPTYWGDDKQLSEIREGTLAGKLERLGRLEGSAGEAAAQERALLALLSAASAAPCSGKQTPWTANLLRNPSFEGGPDQWFGYGTGFVTGPVQGRPGAESVLSAVMHQPGETEGSGAMQVVQLRQAAPMPVLIKGWSKAQNVSGTADGGYAIYVDVNYADNTHEWGWSLPFDTGTHDWQMKRAYLQRSKPITSLDVYAMFRGHSGSVWFDDIAIAPASAAACACGPGEVYSPGMPKYCEPCPAERVCLMGDAFLPP